jgi:predicted RecB family nuclease
VAPRDDDRYRTRRDVSAVPLQGGYAAKRCPVRVQFDVVPPSDVDPIPPSPGERLRMDAGNEFEVEVVAELVKLHPEAVVIDQSLVREAQQEATVAAMAAGVPLVLGGWLPDDGVGHRVGRPDLLVRTPDVGTIHYWPGDVKHHLSLKREEREVAALDPDSPVVSLEELWPDPVQRENAGAHRLRKDDALQLAHYHRMLEACGFAAAEPFGAIVGKERVVVWERLDVPVLPQTWDASSAAKESILERYDFEFSFRLDVVAAAIDGEPIVEPVLVPECGSCPWRGHCLPELEAADSTSLIPRLTYKPWHVLRRLDIRTRSELATLDHASAVALDAMGSATPDLLERAAALDPSMPVADLFDPVGDDLEATSPVAVRLEAAGFGRVGDLARVDPRVASLAGQPVRGLPEWIDQAWVASVGAGVPHLRRGVAGLAVPGADVEIDIDMENAIDGTAYLWGALVDGEYHASCSWEPTGFDVAAKVFVQFWDWLHTRLRAAEEHGRTVAIYCWHQNAEAGALKAGAAAAADLLGRTDAPAAVDELLASDRFVDLLRVFRDQLIHGGGDGLKVVAPKAGFAWRDHAPSGQDSMAWHLAAVGDPDAAERRANRERLLAYNEDDVRATAAIRAWMRALDPAHLP